MLAFTAFAAFFALFGMPGTVAALDFPHAPRLAAGASDDAADADVDTTVFFGGFQLTPGDEGTFELFSDLSDSGNSAVRRLGRYNGRLVGVAAAPGGRLLALTRDGALGDYADGGEIVCRPDDRWDMRTLALRGDEAVALHFEDGAFRLVHPGVEQSWEAVAGVAPLAGVGDAVHVELLVLGDDLHALWQEHAGDLSRGEIRHAVLRDGTWTELTPLPLGDLDAFTARADGNGDGDGIILAARVADVSGGENNWLTARVWRGSDTGIDGGWQDARLPGDVAEEAVDARSFAFASAPSASGDANGNGGALWLLTGVDGARTVRLDARGRVLGREEIAAGIETDGIWPHAAGALTVCAIVLLFVLYCRRSKIVSQKFPSRPPDLISRGAALGVDWSLTSVATAAYHIASGDMRILPDLMAMGDVQEMFWVNLAALCAFMGTSEALFGCTPGKWLAGLRVRSIRGGRASFAQAALRNCIRILDMYPLAGFPGLVGMIATLFGTGRQRIGDIMAGTIVRRHADLGKRKFLLASASPRRLDLLRELGLPVRVQPSDINEDAVKGGTPEETVRMLSQAKAQAGSGVAESGEIVVAADTVVVLDGAVLGKPTDAADAARMLGLLSGRSHSVYTGVTVWDSATGQGVTDVEETEVEFRDLSRMEIESYVATGDPLDKAGGYGVQTGHLVKQVRGSLSNVAGLPMEKLQEMVMALDS